MKTNLQVISSIMNHSKYGALMQGFIMTAIYLYSKRFLDMENPPPEWPAMIECAAWRGCAIELNQVLDKHPNPVKTFQLHRIFCLIGP